MAMTGGKAKLVVSGKPSGWPGPISLYVYYKEKSQSIDTNATILSLGVYVTTPGGWFFGPWTDYGSAIGTASSGSDYRVFNGYCPANTMGTRWLAENLEFTVPHNNDGSKTVTIYWKWGASSSWAGILRPSGSFTVDLTTIPRASKVTATDANIESATTISINRAVSGFTHTIKYAFGTLSGTIATKTANTSIGWNVPAEFYKQIPNSPSGECVITCDTYNGDSKIGTNTTKFIATASKDRCSPGVEVSSADVNNESLALTGNAKRIVSGISKVKVVTTATAKNSATIKTISAYCGGIQKTGANVTFDSVDSAAVYVIVTDSRGYSTRVDDTSLSLVSYIAPTIIPTITRDTPTGDTVSVSVRGKWYNGSFGAVANTIKITVRRKAASDSDYHTTEELTVTTNGSDYTATGTLSGIRYTEAYSFLLRLDDAIYTDANGYRDAKYAIVPLSKGIPVFDWGENDFAFNVPVSIEGTLTIGGVTITESQLTRLLALID